MLILAVDTTSHFGSVALIEGRELIAEVNYISPSTHSRQVFRAVDELLNLSGQKFDNLEGLAVAAGPGSFTGIRIGLSFIKALALASGKKLVGVSALEAISYKLLWPGVELIVPMIDARRGEIFAGAYSTLDGQLREVISPGAYNPGNFLDLIPVEKETYLIGSGVDLYRSLINDKLGPRAIIPNRSYYLAAEIGLIGEDLLKKGQRISPAELKPIYFRKSQAEEKKPVKKR
ncbi:MAG: tRNA (adenosine(37)-N6)-threonylcarbamoyltransferase complex dimerization subunit type 1 TsaB [Candidatus Saccharicenans sp.]|nr:tRNA (adenosine(37)-N6)-threonylcarbamoyltransferase complex dimerization subunit type 1 TsaB [Candidatus Saccharicenans sp.]